MFQDWGDGALVQTGTVAEDQEHVADASWSHRRRPGVEESAVSQLTWLVAERGGFGAHLGSLTEGISAVGSIALVGSPGQHGQRQQHSSEVALGVAVYAGTARESYSPLQSLAEALVVLSQGLAEDGSVIHWEEVCTSRKVGASLEGQPLVAAMPLHETAPAHEQVKI